MKIKSKITPYELDFKFVAGTSRGTMVKRMVWFWELENLGTKTKAIGEVAPLKGLSIDDVPDFELILESYSKRIESLEAPKSLKEVSAFVNDFVEAKYPSIRFALELALINLIQGGGIKLFDSDFTQGKSGIPINGLIWMGEKNLMLERLKKKIEEGYKCIKIKIGAIDFDAECELLDFIRKNYSKDEIILRVDANGAFPISEAMTKLERLAQYDIHSIEQPIKQGNREAMRKLCEKSPVAIALDEELIGIHNYAEKRKLLDQIKPQHIILKPSLLGGLSASQEWIDLAEERNISWWMTSALESNVGLNAIAQYTASLGVNMFQGLGTGQLFYNNIDMPLEINNGELFFRNIKSKSPVNIMS